MAQRLRFGTAKRGLMGDIKELGPSIRITHHKMETSDHFKMGRNRKTKRVGI